MEAERIIIRGHYHCQSNSNEADIIRLLMQHGSDPTLRNHDNKTAIDLCHDVDLVSLMRTGASASTQLPE